MKLHVKCEGLAEQSSLITLITSLTNLNSISIMINVPGQVGTVERSPSLQVISAGPTKVYPELQVAV